MDGGKLVLPKGMHVCVMATCASLMELPLLLHEDVQSDFISYEFGERGRGIEAKYLLLYNVVYKKWSNIHIFWHSASSNVNLAMAVE